MIEAYFTVRAAGCFFMACNRDGDNYRRDHGMDIRKSISGDVQ